jgi:hypothetical protein
MTPDQPKTEQPKSALEQRLEDYVKGLQGLEQKINELHRSRDMQLGAIEAIKMLIKEEQEKTPANVEAFPEPKK